MLSSGPISYPLNRPVAGVYESPDPAPAEASRAGKRGRVMVVSSLKLFSDEWIDKEENSKLADVLFRWLMQDKDVSLEARKESEISEYTRIPNTKVGWTVGFIVAEPGSTANLIPDLR